ncbi:hypothetical protein [Ereboglobus luteus]|uniref:hypothetical protein n=1 Tax=Ereboglobus luteus TaxID=1796921 RepID=UPI001864B5CB|nr:hypothetical protein [Ereboglobus luteus]
MRIFPKNPSYYPRHTMLDNLSGPTGFTPGYSCIGRMRGLAELHGLMHGLRHAENLR